MKRTQASHHIPRVAAVSALALAVLATCQAAWAAPFTPGNFVAYRVAPGTGARAIFLDEYTPWGVRVQSIPLSNGTKPLTASGGGSEGLLTRSFDGTCLAVPGHAVMTGGADPTAGAIRAVAFVAADSGIDNSTTLGPNAFMGDIFRGATSNDCQQAWLSGNGSGASTRGIWYAPKGANAAAQLHTTNTQGIAIATTVTSSATQLYASFAGNGGTLNTIGTGLPTTGIQPATVLPGLATTKNHRGIALLDLDGTPGIDTVYLAVNNETPAAVLRKYSWNGSVWIDKGAVTLNNAHGLIAMDTGDGNVMLLATSEKATSVQRLFDRSGPAGTLTGTFEQVASPEDGNGYFQGLALAPEASPPTMAPAAATNVNAIATGNSVSATWPAVPGAAWYAMEVSSGPDFDTSTTQGVGQTVLTTALSATVANLAVGPHKLRVRAVNSAGGSTSTVSTTFTAVAPPVTSLRETLAYSGVVGDTSDPLASAGIAFTVDDASTSVTATSSNPAVVRDSDLVATGTGTTARALRITPTGVGYADISVTLTNAGGASVTRTIKYAASDNTIAGTGTRWYAGRSDGSTAIVRDGGSTFLVGDDEGYPDTVDASGNAGDMPPGTVMFAYSATQSGQPVAPVHLADATLNVNDAALQTAAACTTKGFTGIKPTNCKSNGEVDIEASFLGNDGRVYVAGSHSNSSSGHSRPDRWRFFAATPSGAGSTTNLTVNGYYEWLREDLRNWDAQNAHGLGAGYFGIEASSAGGGTEKAPEADTLSGFSIEGMTTSRDGSAAWLGFRAPLVQAPGVPTALVADSAANRTHALIIPVNGFSSLPTSTGGTKRGPQELPNAIGTAIRLDLQGRGIREISKNAHGEYLIIAGSPNGVGNFALYSWDGSTTATGLATNLRLRSTAPSLTQFKTQTGCSNEGFGELPASLDAGGIVDVISDCGDANFYGDSPEKPAKELVYAGWKKFRADKVTMAALPTVALTGGTAAATALSFTAMASEAGALYAVALPASAAAPSWEQIVAGTDATGAGAPWASGATAVGTTATPLTASGLSTNTAYTLYAVNVSTGGYASTRAQLSQGTSALIAQSITFSSPPASPTLLGTAPFTVSAVGGASGNPVVFASGSSAVCTVNGATVTLVTAGTCVLNASQAGGGGFAAGAQSYSFQVTMPTGSSIPLVGQGAYSGNSGAVLGGAWQFASNSAGFKALPSGSAPNGYSFPHGMFDFALINGTNGSAATVQLNLPAAAPTGAVLWKYGYQTQGATTRTWYPFPGTYNFTNGRMSVEFTIQDGAVGQDDDQVVNGIIIDPVALGLPGGPAGAQVAAIPTLSEWARGLLALLLGGLAALRMRRPAVR